MKQRIVRSLFLAISVVLITSPVVANDADGVVCDRQRVQDALRSISDHYQPGSAHDADESILLVALDDKLAVGDRVVFEVRRDGERRLVEELHIRHDEFAVSLGLEGGDTDAPAALELLGSDAGMRAYFETLYEAGADLELAVLVNGRLVAERSYGDVVEASSALRDSGPVPLATERFGDRAHVVPLRDRLPAKSCQSNCDQQVDNCYDNCVFTPNSGPCFAQCDANYDDCIDSCGGGGGGGGCNPSSTSSSQDTLVSITNVGPIRCMRFPLFGFFDDYIRARQRWRRVTTTVTTNADCSQTTNTSTSFFNTHCYRLFSFGCTRPLSAGFFCPL